LHPTLTIPAFAAHVGVREQYRRSADTPPRSGNDYCTTETGQQQTFSANKNGDPKAAVYSYIFTGIYFLRRKINKAITPATSKGKILGSGIVTSSGVA
jgi:hypothetical protein